MILLLMTLNNFILTSLAQEAHEHWSLSLLHSATVNFGMSCSTTA